VGVLIDRGTVSAAEVAVEFALRSTRATVFGEPTAGALDYEQVSIVPLDPRERRWFLGYPTITRDTTLPAGGIRGKGLQPDVRVTWASVADPIAYVVHALGR
jgi:C-terminal processing protease CtpA/Prc